MAKGKVIIPAAELQPFKMKNGTLQVKAIKIEEAMETLARLMKQLAKMSRINSTLVGFPDNQIAEAVDHIRQVQPGDYKENR